MVISSCTSKNQYHIDCTAEIKNPNSMFVRDKCLVFEDLNLSNLSLARSFKYSIGPFKKDFKQETIEEKRAYINNHIE